MTLVQLRHLLALSRTGSFSLAAQDQFLTQPALSRSIRALEDELGMPLFDRVGRRIELTPFGRETLARAQQILEDADELTRAGPSLAQGEHGLLRIGLGSGPGALLMTPLLLQAARERPGLCVEIARRHRAARAGPARAAAGCAGGRCPLRAARDRSAGGPAT